MNDGDNSRNANEHPTATNNEPGLNATGASETSAIHPDGSQPAEDPYGSKEKARHRLENLVTPPNMDGYLEYKRRMDQGDQELRSQTTKDWLAYLFMEKPATVHYQEAMWTERDLKAEGTELHNPTLAIRTGRKMAELREQGFDGSDNEALFAARRKVIFNHACEMENRAEFMKQMKRQQWKRFLGPLIR